MFTIEEGKPVSQADILDRLQNFLGGLDGWSIDAYANNELYFSNTHGSYGLKLANLVRSDSASTIYNAIWAMSAKSYNPALSFYAQDGSSIHNLNNNSKISSTYPTTTIEDRGQIEAICLENYIPEEFIFLADSETLIISVEVMLTKRAFIIFHHLNKTHDFSGGNLLLSTHSAGFHIPLLRPCRIEGMFAKGTVKGVYYSPLGFNNYTYVYNDSTGHYGGRRFYYNGEWYSSYSGQITTPMREIVSNSKGSAVELPFSPGALYSVGSSMFTGLTPLITVDFFALNHNNRYIHIGDTGKLKQASWGVFSHKQRVWYGEKEYYCLNFGDNYGNVNQTLLVELN